MYKIGFLFIVAAAFAFAFNPAPPKKQDVQLIMKKQFDTKSGGAVKIDAPGADIIMTAWDKESVAFEIFATNDALDDHTFQFDDQSGDIRLKIERSGAFLGRVFKPLSYCMRIEVKAPRQSDISLATAGGDIRVSGIEGEGSINTAGGDIHSDRGIGILDCSTAGGDIKVRAFSGKLKCSTAGGDIKAETAMGKLQASTAGGDIQLLARSSTISASSIGGDISLDYFGENKGMNLSSTGGDIHIKAPKTLKANLQFSSMGGDVESNIATTRFKKKSMHSLSAEVNGGGPKIECSSTGGDIVISD
jgi:DUF4097 and DUF4098 domain-containing protein YvlB